MELRQLRSLVAVAEEGQFSRAATRLGISQPSLSVQVARLEGELGLALVDRSSRQLQMTEAGELLVTRARVVLSEITDVTGEMQSLRGVLSGRLTLGVTRTPGPCDLMVLLRAFHRHHPGVDLSVRDGLSVELAEQLRHDRLDLAVLSEVPGRPWRGISALPLASEPLVGVLPEGHALARSQSVRLHDLCAERFISFPRGATIRDHLEQAAREIGASPHVALESTEVTRIRALVAAGLGIGILPASDAASPGPAVATVAVTAPELCYSVSLSRRRGRRLSPAARAFLDLSLAGT